MKNFPESFWLLYRSWIDLNVFPIREDRIVYCFLFWSNLERDQFMEWELNYNAVRFFMDLLHMPSYWFARCNFFRINQDRGRGISVIRKLVQVPQTKHAAEQYVVPNVSCTLQLEILGGLAVIDSGNCDPVNWSHRTKLGNIRSRITSIQERTGCHLPPGYFKSCTIVCYQLIHSPGLHWSKAIFIATLIPNLN